MSETKITQPPITQERRPRTRWPAFARHFPRWRIRSNPGFKLIPEEDLEMRLAKVDPTIAASIREQLALLEKELMGLFRSSDLEAKRNQNRYRQYQIVFIILALAATVIGSLQGMARESNTWLSVLALFETVVALAAVLVSQIAAYDPPQPRWLKNRRQAEGLRQEFFRYLMYATPYNHDDTAFREILLAKRAALINRGDDPETSSGTGVK